jgi:lysyl-tRNA synthetase class 2
MDPKHNPEFTTVELYQAYADFHDMMDIAEGIISGAAKEIHGTYEVEWLGEKIDLTPGWRRLTMVDAVKEYAGVDFGAISDDEEAVKAAEAIGVELAETADRTWGNALYACFDQKVEEKLIQPTFITMYPVEVSPLTKASPEDPRLTERFELFICHSELANAYSELNDPIVQRERFEKQLAAFTSMKQMFVLNAMMDVLSSESGKVRKFIVPSNLKKQLYEVNLETNERLDLVNLDVSELNDKK